MTYQYSMNDDLSDKEKELFTDKHIEAAFQGYAHYMVERGQTLNLRRRFLEDLKRLFAQGRI